MLHYMKIIMDLEHETPFHDSSHGPQHMISTSPTIVGSSVTSVPCTSLEELPLQKVKRRESLMFFRIISLLISHFYFWSNVALDHFWAFIHFGGPHYDCPQYYVSPIHSYIEDLNITSFGEKTILLFSLEKRTWRSLLAKKTKEKKKRKKIQFRTMLSMLILFWRDQKLNSTKR